MSTGTAAIVTGAVIAGMLGAAINLGASRVFWLLLGFGLGRRKGRRVKR